MLYELDSENSENSWDLYVGWNMRDLRDDVIFVF